VVLALLPTLGLRAAVVPEDRGDVMYHRYEGGGVTVQGPALLIRKGIGESVSLYGGYYVDDVSSASIDVVTTASPYKEKRVEKSAGVDYLYRDTLLGFSFTRSDEPDYKADTMAFKYVQETFGGMTTVSLGYTVGSDSVLNNTDSSFSDSVDRYQWRFGISQVLTKAWLLNLDYEAITEEGFLNSPYRAARVLNTPVPERYPRARSTHAAALTSILGLDSRSSLRLGYRFFADNWDISANTVEAVYSRYFGESKRWLGDLRLRNYSQDRASFYADNLTREQNYMARDKELSTFTSRSIGVQGTYKLFERRYGLERVHLGLADDYVYFEYADFTDTRTGQPYEFKARIWQLYCSAWF
jgi:hypothetical protein